MENRALLPAHVPEIDGLRGAAILAVMAFHARVPFLKGGYVGVDVFFVLSGFLVTVLLVQDSNMSVLAALRSFYIRRAFRLLPALMLLVAVYCLISWFILTPELAEINYIDSVITLLFLTNWARAYSVHPPDFLAHTWSLSLEGQFYLIWPWALLFVLRCVRAPAFIASIPLGLALISWGLRSHLFGNGVYPGRLYNGLDTRLDGLMMGACVGLLVSTGLLHTMSSKLLIRCLFYGAPASAVSLFGFCFLSDWRDPWMYHWGFQLVSILTSVILLDLLLSPAGIVRRLLGMWWLRRVGEISYGLYLWHFVIYRSMTALGFHDVITASVGTLLTFLVASLSWSLVEKSLLLYGKRLSV